MSHLSCVVQLLDTEQFAGTERYVLTLSGALTQMGVRSLVACRSDSPLHRAALQQQLATLPILKGGNPMRTADALAKALCAEGIDLLHAHNGRTTLLAALTNQKSKVPAVMTQHFLEPQFTTYRGFKRRAAALAHHWVNSRLAHIIAISDAVRASMMVREGVEASRITTVYNGIAPVVVSPGSVQRLVEQELPIAPGQPLIVCVARLELEKDVSTLITAMSRVAAVYPNAHCLIAGQGSQESSLRSQIAQQGMEATVHLLGFRDDVLAIIAAGDMFVLPSLAEPFGLVVLEAMALGKPVIATRAGGPLEIVEEGKTGLLVAPADPKALAQAILSLLADPTTAKRMGQAGRARFEQRFTARHMAQATLDVYNQVLSATSVR